MKNIRSKDLILPALTVACVGILAACFLISRPPESDFQVEDESVVADPLDIPPASSPVPQTNETGNTILPGPVATKDPISEYPKVVEESDEKVTIEFTPNRKDVSSKTPDPPISDGDPTDPATPPSYPPTETQPDSASERNNNGPTPGSTGNNGAVYDPVFGWVVPGQVEQTPADSTGDPTKMVGSM